jgi:peptide deformylase
LNDSQVPTLPDHDPSAERLEILTWPHPVLSQKAVDATPSPELSMLLHAMVKTLKETKDGIGLAAPQVGVSVRAFVMGTEEQGYLAIVNPRIVKRSGIKIKALEECLSVPGVRRLVKRDNHITVEAINAEGTPCKFECKGLAAACVQHELDHLNGKTIAS